MSVHFDKNTGDLIFDGWEQGIKSSPFKGVANLQGVNISTETGEVMTSYIRFQQSMTSTTATGNLVFVDSSHVALGISGSNNIFKGMWITVTNSSHPGELANGNYYVLVTPGSFLVLSSTYNGSGISGYTSGLTANITLLQTMGKPIAHATEIYQSSGTTLYRYYILDSRGLVWVYDTLNEGVLSPGDTVPWFLPDNSANYFGNNSAPTGIAVYNGFLHVFAGNQIFCKPTSDLGNTSSSSTNWATFASGNMMSPVSTSNIHYGFTGHQGKLYYTDGTFIGSIFANTALVATTTANIQSFCSYTAVTTTGTASLISGSIPYNGTDNTVRIPAVFFVQAGGTAPSALTSGTMYYIKWLGASTPNMTFEVYAAASGGSALNVATGAVGTQYFNTYYPVSAGGKATITFTPQRLNLPSFETAQCMAEIGNQVIIGGRTNTLYPWDQVSTLPASIIPTPESNITSIISVNNVAYFLAGNKGNVYVTNGSIASLVTTIPDYCAGIPGSASTYVEGYFTWGDIMYLRGRIYISILDQNSSKAGNCGGIWSFVPTQNYFVEQDTGIALRLENQNSYGTYNGYAPVLIPTFNQGAKGPQYWSGWQDGISSPNYGVDFTATTSGTTGVIETEMIDIGTYLDKGNFTSVQSTYGAALVSGESVTVKWRAGITDVWSAFTDSTSGVDNNAGSYGYRWPVPFANIIQAQFQITLTPIVSSGTADSFVQFKELRLKK